MGLKFVFLFTILSFVSAAPTINMLKDDLKLVAERTSSQILEEEKQILIKLAQLIVDNKYVEEMEIEKWQKLIEWLQNAKPSDPTPSTDRLPTFDTDPYIQAKNIINNYSKGVLTELNSKYKEFKTQRYVEFQTRATEIIRLSRESGFSDDKLNEVYNSFVQNPQDHYYTELIEYLTQ